MIFSTGDLPLIITISDTRKKQTKRLDSDNTDNAQWSELWSTYQGCDSEPCPDQGTTLILMSYVVPMCVSDCLTTQTDTILKKFAKLKPQRLENPITNIAFMGKHSVYQS
jgi:hypothetical protein